MAGNRVMIVDDNEALLEELKETLSLCGYEPITASDSSNAVKTAQEAQPDVIILDLKMGRKNGFQVAEELSQEASTRDIPIIAMSGYFPIEGDPNLLDLSRMSGQIKKPFNIADLISKLEKVLD